MTKLTYDQYLLYKRKFLGIVGLQINNTLIFIKDFFAIIEINTIKTAKFITKNHIYFFFKMFIKFNSI